MNIFRRNIIPRPPDRGVLPGALERTERTVPLASERVVTLASLSRNLPDAFLTTELAKQLHRETGRSVLLLHLTASAPTDRLQGLDGHRRQGLAAGGIGAGSLEVIAPEVSTLALHISHSSDPGESFRSLLEDCQDRFHYVLLHAACDVAVPTLFACFESSGRHYLLLQASSGDLYHRELLVRELRVRGTRVGNGLTSIFCRQRGTGLANPILRGLSCDGIRLIQDCPTADEIHGSHPAADRFLREDIRRLAREIGQCRLGLALSSGGARGLSHIGIMQVLEENGIAIDVVAGCSMGSYVGAVWAYGYNGTSMENLAREVEHRWGIFELIDPFLLPRRGFMRGARVRRRLEHSIGDVHFAELPRPLRVVATNLYTLERKVFTQGGVAEAVHASSAIPGAVAPVLIDGEYYIDGGVCDPLPVDLLEDMGVERILAVNTIPTPAYLRCGEELRRERMTMGRPRGNWLERFLHGHLNYFASGNILDTIFRSFHGAQIRVAEQAGQRADLVLRPLTLEGRWHDFRHPGKYIEIGRREAEDNLEKILAWAKGGIHDHEIGTTHKSLATPA